MRFKVLSLVAAGLLLSACETEKPTPPMAGSTFEMPNASSGKANYKVLMDGKKKEMMKYESTDVDVISETSGCCPDGEPKETALLRTNRELEVKVGDHTPNIMIDDVDISCCGKENMVEVNIAMKVAHGAGENAGMPIVEVPVFFTAMDLGSGEVYSNGHAMVKVDLNKAFERQYVRAWFDVSDLKARGLKGWSLVMGISKSEMNRKFEAEVAKAMEHKIAQAGGHDMNTKRTGEIAPALRGSDSEGSAKLVLK